MLNKYGAMDQSQNVPKKKQVKVKRRIFQDESESEMSDDSFKQSDTESERSMSSIDEEDNLTIDDYVLVKFSTKTIHVYYIGKNY